jgi:hypothetical protein
MPTPGNFEIAIAVASAVFFLVAAAAYFAAAKRRAAIDAALKGSPNAKPIGMFNLARNNAMDMLEQKSLAIPEGLWTYDSFYLERFARAAHAAHLPRGGTALESYMGPTMNADILFAIAFGLFIALFEFGAATVFLKQCPTVGCAVLFFACMGAVYGVADVAEDLKLKSILKDWHGVAAEQIRVDGGEAAAANALTRIKIVTISLSILGGAVFLIFTGIAAVIYRRQENPIPTAD